MFLNLRLFVHRHCCLGVVVIPNLDPFVRRYVLYFFLSLLGPNLEIRPIYDLKRFQTLRERARVILQKNLTPICSITKNPSKLLSVQAFWLKSSKNGLKNDVELRLNA